MIKKLILGILALLVVVAIGAIVFVTLMLDRTVKTAVERFGPEITGTTVTVDSVSISLMTGAATIRGLYVGNPEGFSSEKAFSFGEVHVDLYTGSILKDVIVVEEIRIIEPEFVFERTLRGSNLDSLKSQVDQNLARYRRDPSSAPAAQAETEPKRFIIQDFQIADGSIDLQLMGQGGNVPLPAISLQDIGQDAGGITADQAAAEILGIVLDQVVAAAVRLASDVLRTGESLGSDAGEAAGGLMDTVRGLFD